MRILQELHADGHTIILVTHDMAVAAHATRVIEISDGAIIADRRSTRTKPGRPWSRHPARAGPPGADCRTALARPCAWPCAP